MIKKFNQFINEKIITENTKIMNRCTQLIKDTYNNNEDYINVLETIDKQLIRFFVFSGTKTKKDLLLDITPGLSRISVDIKESKVWSGFLQKSNLFFKHVKNSIDDDLKNDKKVNYVFAGHSLGAAIASIIYVKLHRPGKLILFGSPQIGNIAFFKELFSGDDDWVKHNIHIIYLENDKHDIDVISNLPPVNISNYKKEFNEYLDLLHHDTNNKHSFFALHSFDNYQKQMNDYTAHKE